MVAEVTGGRRSSSRFVWIEHQVYQRYSKAPILNIGFIGGPVGNWLAQWYPDLFATSFAVRLRKS